MSRDHYELRAAKPEELDQIYKIRYNAYLPAGLIQPNETGVLRDIYDTSGFARVFVALIDGRIAGTVRLVQDSDLGLPMDDEGFGPELNKMRRRKRRLLEGGRLAIAPAYQNARNLSLDLCRYSFRVAYQSGFDDLVAMAADHHEKFYRQIFGFEKIKGDHKTQYCEKSIALRLDLCGLVRRYKESRIARRYKLYDYFSTPDNSGLVELPN